MSSDWSPTSSPFSERRRLQREREELAKRTVNITLRAANDNRSFTQSEQFDYDRTMSEISVLSVRIAEQEKLVHAG